MSYLELYIYTINFLSITFYVIVSYELIKKHLSSLIKLIKESLLDPRS